MKVPWQVIDAPDVSGSIQSSPQTNLTTPLELS